MYTDIYSQLYAHFGPQSWWPGDTPFEIMVGAVLTQNTNWGNVEKAIVNLKRARALSLSRCHAIPESDLAELIRPAGYFNVKARRLKNLCAFIIETYGSVVRMKREPLETLRPLLLSVNGIGPETADSILLYALGKPVFVVDAYTKRFLYRHNLIRAGDDYHAMQAAFEKHLPTDAALYNEYHALIVRLGKEYCRPHPRCEQCPLRQVNYNPLNRCDACYRALQKGEKACRCH